MQKLEVSKGLSWQDLWQHSHVHLSSKLSAKLSPVSSESIHLISSLSLA